MTGAPSRTEQDPGADVSARAAAGTLETVVIAAAGGCS